MSKKVLAIMGSYRKDGINDQTVDAILGEARDKGAETKKIYLTDVSIDFCRNCRTCAKDDPAKSRGACVMTDDMEKLLKEIDAADALILASPINMSTVTAVMKRFLERLIVYSYWPWGQQGPRMRSSRKTKTAAIVTSSASPALIGRILMPNALQVLKSAAGLVGAKVVGTIYFGMVNMEEKQRLNPRHLAIAHAVAEKLV